VATSDHTCRESRLPGGSEKGNGRMKGAGGAFIYHRFGFCVRAGKSKSVTTPSINLIITEGKERIGIEKRS